MIIAMQGKSVMIDGKRVSAIRKELGARRDQCRYVAFDDGVLCCCGAGLLAIVAAGSVAEARRRIYTGIRFEPHATIAELTGLDTGVITEFERGWCLLPTTKANDRLDPYCELGAAAYRQFV